MAKKGNYENLKYTLIFLFILLLVVGIIIGIKRGKRLAQDSVTEFQYAEIFKKPLEKIKRQAKSIMAAPAQIFEIDTKSFEPVNYVYRISMKEKLSIIDEEGNTLKTSSPDNIFYTLFSYNIIDTDIKTDEELKSKIKFELKPQLETEYYPGIVENIESEQKSSLTIKESFGIIKTNI